MFKCSANYCSSMKKKFASFVLVLLTHSCYAGNDGDCTFDDEIGIDWFANMLTNDVILDNETSYRGEFAYTPPLQMTLIGNSSYLTVTQDDEKNVLIVTATDEFQNIDKETPKGANENFLLNITLTLSLECKIGTSTLTFKQPIRDTNNNPPTFKETSYEIEAPMPLPPKYELSSLGIPIKVEDIDFTNQNVGISIDPQETFDIQITSDPSDTLGKTYIAEVRVTEYLWLSEDTTYNLTATDSGDPSLSARVQFTIKVDKSHVIPDVQLTFDEPSYKFECIVDDQNVPTITTTSKIILNTLSDGTVTVDLGNKYFNAAYDSGTKEVTIAPTGEPLESSLTTVLDLTLTATLDGSSTAKTIILMNLPPQVVIEIPQFSQPYYTAKYTSNPSDDDDVVTPEQDITVTENANVEISKDSEYSGNFNVEKDSNGKYNVIVSKDLGDDILQKGGEIVLKLEATLTGSGSQDISKGYSVLIVQLPEIVTAEFDEPSYKFECTVDDQNIPTITTTSKIILNTLSDGTVTVDLGNKYFKAAYDSGTKEVTIAPTGEPLESSLTTVLDLTLTATLDGSSTAKTIILINLPPQVIIEVPQFSQPYYTAKYTSNPSDDDDVVTPEQDITVTENANVEISKDSEYSNNFDLENSNGKWNVIVGKDLGDDILQKGGEIVLKLEATLTGSGSQDVSKGYSVLIVQLPEIVTVETPKFSMSLYNAVYKGNGDATDSVTVSDGPISIVTKVDESLKVSVTGSYADNFNVTNIKDGDYTIAVYKPLDPAVLKDNYEIMLNLEATIDGASETGTSIVAVVLPKASVKPIKFSSVLYEAKYEATGSTGTVTVTDGITLEGGQNNQIKVLPPYDTNFEAIFNNDLNVYEIIVDDILDSDVVDQNSEIYVSLEAYSDLNSIEHALATVALKMPEKILDVVPTFSATYYKAEYKQESDGNDTVTVLSNIPITITSDHNSETIVNVVDNYSDNFQPVLEDNEWKISVLKKLDDSILNSEKEIFVTLEAFLDGNENRGSATLIVYLPNQDLKPAPTFSLTYYTAEYTDKGELNMTSDPIEISSADADTTDVTLKGIYSENFNLTPDADFKAYALNLIKPLDDSIKDNEILLEVVATLPGSIGDGSATVVINLPTKETIKFDSAFYTATYTINKSDDDDVKLGSDITIVGEYSKYDVTGEYSSNFGLSCDTGKCTLSVKNDLPDDVLSQKTEIIVTLEAYKDEKNKATAPIIVALPLQDPTLTPVFTQSGYVANYKQNSGENNDAVDLENGPIQIQGDDPGSITFKEKNPNFDLVQDSGKWSVQVLLDLNDEQLKDTSIVLEIEAKFTDGVNAGSSALIIRLPKSNPSDTLSFTQNVYTGDYVEGSPPEIRNLDNPIEIQNPGKDIGVSLKDGDYSSYFNEPSIDAGGLVTLTFKTSLDPDMLQTKSVIIVTLEAADSTGETSTEVVIKLPKTVVPTGVFFEKSVYEAEYQLGTGTETPKLNILNKIQVFTKDNDYSTVDVTADKDDSNWKYFNLVYNHDQNVDVTVKDSGLPDDVLKDNNVITLNIVATKEDDSVTSALIITLPSKDNSPTIGFESSVYYTKYIEDGNGGKPSIGNTDIVLTGSYETIKNEDISLEGDNKDHFSFDYKDGVINVALKQALPDDILNGDVSAIAIDVVVVKQPSEAIRASLVILLPKTVVPSSIQFTRTVYLSDYIQDDANNAHIELEDNEEIEIKAEDSCNGLECQLLGDNKDFFDYNCTIDCKVTVTLKGVLPDSVLKADSSIISVDIEAKKGVDAVSSTLVVKLPPKFVSTSIYFLQPTYLASYSDSDKSISMVGSEITLGADDASKFKDINVELAGDNAMYFEKSYDDKGKVTLTTPTGFPPDIVNAESAVVSVDVKATLKDETVQTTLVVELPKKVVATSIYFLQSVYLVNYTKDNDDHKISDCDITISADDSSKLKDIDVTIDTESQTYFKPDYDKNGKVTISLQNNLSDDILDNESIYSITITATRDAETVTSTLVVQLPVRVVPASFNFNDTAFLASYYEDGGKYKFKVDGDITVNGDTLSSLDIALEGEYKDYFKAEFVTVTRSTTTITITLLKDLPNDVVKNNNVITLKLVASKGDERMSSALVIKLPTASENGNDPDTKGATAFIAVIAVLAVLLVAAIVGSAVFYYRKLRNRTVSPSFGEFEEKPERFRKNSAPIDSKKFEHPTRRPTTGIQYPVNGISNAEETNTDFDLPSEKRKSVAFDEKVDELEIESGENEVEEENDENALHERNQDNVFDSASDNNERKDAGDPEINTNL